MIDLPDSAPLGSDALDPRGEGWKNVNPSLAGGYSARIRYVIGQAGCEPDYLIAGRCQDLHREIAVDNDLYIAVFKFLNATERRLFKAYASMRDDS